jgi:multiple sugar transport system permease protein
MVAPAKFIGLGNYKNMFHGDQLFWRSLHTTFIFTFVSVPLQLLLSFFIALLLDSNIKGKQFFRTVIYLPSLIPVIVSSTLWLWLFNRQYGLFNVILDFFHLPAQDWISNPDTVIPSLILMSCWSIGNYVIIFLAGLQSVPREIKEAISIDGGNALHILRHAIFPFISPIVLYNLIIGIINGLQTFTQPFIMTDGGPANASLTYVLHLYKKAFQYSEMGYANAMALFLLGLTIILSVILFKFSDRWVYYVE